MNFATFLIALGLLAILAAIFIGRYIKRKKGGGGSCSCGCSGCASADICHPKH